MFDRRGKRPTVSERGAQRSIRFRDVRCCLFVSLDFLASVSAGSSLSGLQSQQGPVSAGLSLSRTQSQQASVSPAKSDERRGCSLTNSKLTPLIGIFFKFAPFGRSASATRTIGDTAEPPFESQKTGVSSGPPTAFDHEMSSFSSGNTDFQGGHTRSFCFFVSLMVLYSTLVDYRSRRSVGAR